MHIINFAYLISKRWRSLQACYDIWPPRYRISSKYIRYSKACMRAEQLIVLSILHIMPVSREAANV